MPVIYVVAQIGLVLYMFLVGLDFDVELLRKRAKSAVTVSWAGILTPFALGALDRLGLPRRHGPLRREGLDRRGRALHGRGDVDHRLPDARADHLRARPLGDVDGDARARGRLGRRRGGVVHPRRRPRELLGAGLDRRLGDRRRHRLRPLRLLRPPARPRARRGLDRQARGLRQRGPSRGAHAPRRAPPGTPTRSGSTRSSAPSSSARRCRGARSPGGSRSRSSRSR